jgi:hypothetical protein
MSFQTTSSLVLILHALAAFLAWYIPGGSRAIFALNVIVSVAVLAYAAMRARSIFAAHDWPYLALVLAEGLILVAALWAFRSSRPATLTSYVAFTLHTLTSVAAVIFAFTFKMKLM